MSNRRMKERRAARSVRQRNQMASYIIIGVVAVLVVGGIIYVVSQQPAPSPEGITTGTSSPDLTEEAIAIMESTHIERGTPHEAYNSDPPTSGPHYADNMIPVAAGFYDEVTQPLDEEIIHAEEHGYVVFWYDCAKAPDGNCDVFKAALRKLREDLGGTKLIVLPRSMPEMLALTSWGKLQRLDAFDTAAMTAFYRRNIGQAPEPNGP